MKKIAVFSMFICLAQGLSAIAPDVHDPVLAMGEDGRFYIYSTGVGITVQSSADMDDWRHETPVFDHAPAWAVDSVPGYRGHTWAPDICRHGGLWHLYYSCSTFGKNGSAIGHAVNKTLDTASPDFGWQDRGVVIVSHSDRDNWNAIDPNVIVGDDGRVWMTFGSFWDGIQIIELSADDMQTPVSEPVTIARRKSKDTPLLAGYRSEEGVEAGDNAIEAPFIYRHGGYYYLFVSHDYCCRGDKSTYKTVYGRAMDIAGPYYDKHGKRMDAGGGVYLYGPDGSNYGVGHCSVYDVDDRTVFIAHAYAKGAKGKPRLFVDELEFDNDGWIIRRE